MCLEKLHPTLAEKTAPLEEVKIGLERFLTFAVYFLIFDIFAFVMVTSFYTIGLMPIVYSLIVLMAVAMLIFGKKTAVKHLIKTLFYKYTTGFLLFSSVNPITIILKER